MPGTYVSRRVIRKDAMRLRSAFENAGVVPIVAPFEMHVTLAHSREAFEASAQSDVIEVSTKGASVSHLGREGALVLHLKSKSLSDRNREFVKAGAVSDFDSYKPHITLSYMAADIDPETIDLADVDLPESIKLGPEVFEPIREYPSGDSPMVDRVMHFGADATKVLNFSADMQEVEIFKAGEWNGKKYTVSDIDRIIESFDPVGDFKPPVKLGHNEEPDAPAFGWVTSLKRVGESLFATFSDVPDALIDDIREGRFDSVSVELFSNFKRNGRKIPIALASVAVLGAQVPAVGGLKPLRESLPAEKLSQDAAVVRINLSEVHEVAEENKAPAPDAGNPADGGGEDKQAARLAEIEAKLEEKFEQKFNVVVADNEKLKAQLAEANQKLSTNTSALEIQKLQEQLAKAAKFQEKLETDAREEKARKLAHSCVKPDIRNHIQALALKALEADAESDKPAVCSFSVDGDQTWEAGTFATFENLVERINQAFSVMFDESGMTTDFEHIRDYGSAQMKGSPSDQLDAMANTYMERHGIKDYGEAFERVCNDPNNRALVARYNRPGA